MLELTVLGNSSRYLVPLGAGTSYLLRHNGLRVLFDAGNGTHLRLAEVLAGEELDAVVVTHFHVDSASDILPVLFAMKKPTPVFIPVRAAPRFMDLLRAYSMDRSWLVNAEVVGVRHGSRHNVGDAHLRFVTAHHGCPAVAVRVDVDGHAFTYLSDTGWRPWLPELARGADLVLAHTLLLDKDAQGEVGETNLSAGAAGRLAKEAGAKRLALAHVPFYLNARASVDEARAHFDGDVVVLKERETYTM